MTVSPKAKKILMWGGHVAGFVLIALATVKCSNNAGERDAAVDSLAVQTARADSLQKVLKKTMAIRDVWIRIAQERQDIIENMQADTSCADSVAVLNDSIAVLNDSIAGLNRRLTECRNKRQAPRRVAKNNRRNAKNGRRVVNNNQACVPSKKVRTVVVNNGNNNTVNINNGTINNYYAPEKQKPKARCVSASVTIERTYEITYQRQKCR